jgi:hypothetical protein
VTSGRLSRNELGWLLAQEARGAAKTLRENVTLLTQPPPPSIEPKISDRTEVHLESTLNALDDAINLISELETGPSSRGRRGRIDLAALLYELAPNARIAIQPGAGTEVFGEESELRRLLHVLVFQSNSPAGSQESSSAEIRIRREGDWVRISVDLGPDVSASIELERRWLSRMAIRLGGRLELDGGTESVILPADASVDQSEVADLKKELEQAQQLGEAYARELASVFAAATETPQSATERAPSEEREHRFDQLVNTARGILRVLGPMLAHLREDAGLAESSASGRGLHERLVQRTSVLAEVVGELRRVASTTLDEPTTNVDLGALIREIAEPTTNNKINAPNTIRMFVCFAYSRRSFIFSPNYSKYKDHKWLHSQPSSFGYIPLSMPTPSAG